MSKYCYHDVWQVRNRVSLSSIVGIGIPVRKLDGILTCTSNRNSAEILFQLINLAESLGINRIEIDFAEKYEKEKNSNKMFQLKLGLISRSIEHE